LILLNDEELTEHFKDKYIENRHANLDRKNREIKLMRDLYNKGMTLSAISKQTGYI
jgi:hypothetical protein